MVTALQAEAGDRLTSLCIQPDAWLDLGRWGSALMDKNSLPLAVEAPNAVLLHTDHRGVICTSFPGSWGTSEQGTKMETMSPGVAAFGYMASLWHVPSLLSSARASPSLPGPGWPMATAQQPRETWVYTAELAESRAAHMEVPFSLGTPSWPLSKILSGNKPEQHPTTSRLLPYAF